MSVPVTLTRPPAVDGTTFTLPEGERCDRCGARAYVATAHRVDGRELTLAWCAHHWDAIERSGALGGADVVVDRRGRLVPQQRSHP